MQEFTQHFSSCQEDENKRVVMILLSDTALEIKYDAQFFCTLKSTWPLMCENVDNFDSKNSNINCLQNMIKNHSTSGIMPSFIYWDATVVRTWYSCNVLSLEDFIVRCQENKQVLCNEFSQYTPMSFYTQELPIPVYTEHFPTICDSSCSLPISVKDRGIGALLGLAVGDALGVALEFRYRSVTESDVVLNMIGNPWLYKRKWAGQLTACRPGEWTDDTSMALVLAQSLVIKGQFDPADALLGWYLWKNIGFLNVRNLRRDRLKFKDKLEPAYDVGTTTGRAIDYYKRHSKCDLTQNGRNAFPNISKSSPSNGAIMRAAPIPMFFYDAIEDPKHHKIMDAAKTQAELTHGHPESIDSSTLLSYMIALAMDGSSKEDVLSAKGFNKPIIQSVADLISPSAPWRSKPRSKLEPEYEDESGGSAVFTLECFFLVN